MADFGKTIAEAYTFEGESIELGRGVHEGKLAKDAAVRLPLATSNRHGLIAGATGTGKTRTLQLLAEQLSAAGVPVVAADMKGDLSGIAQPGETGGPDEKGLPILDLADLRALLTFFDTDEGKKELKGIGGVSTATIGVLLRSLVQLEDGGGTEFFGEPQLEIADLLRTAPDGRGVISCLELPAVQDKPKLFSTVLMWLLAELFEQLPEVGDVPKPKLFFFFDEAHLLFADATDAFRESVVQTVRLIRSKGVGVFFITQTPKDIPADVLAQLGNRIQHALRAFTPQDAKALKATVSTFPTTELYDLEELLTQLGTGEAAVTILSESGVPTPVVHTKLRGPLARMAPADDVEGAAKASPLFAKYGARVDRESARELLAARMERHAPEPEREPVEVL